MHAAFGIALVLLALSAQAGRADECEAKAAEIADRTGLEPSQRSQADVIALGARTASDDDYGAYLSCTGPHGMSLRYFSPPAPAHKWFEFVGSAGAILTGVKSASIALEARNCVENSRFRKGEFVSLATAFWMSCSTEGSDGRAEIFLASR